MTEESEMDRIGRITEAVRKAAEGDLSCRIEASRKNDEIDRLADAINQLLEIMTEHFAEKRQTESVLRDSEEKHRRLKANIPGMVYLFAMHPDGTFSFPYVNEASKQLFDISPQDLMRDVTLITRLIHPDDRERFDISVKRSAETLQPWREVLRHIVNGEVRWYDCMSRPELQPNGDILWDGIILEITDRMRAIELLRESKQRLSDIISASPIGIAIYDGSGQCIEGNESLARIVGATRRQILEQNYGKIESWKRSGLLDVAQMTVRTRSLNRHEVVTISSFGKEVFLDCHLVPFGSKDLLFMAQDITERKQLEEQLLQSQKMEAVGQLAGGIAHDFNNMLSVILGHAELVKTALPAAHPLLKNVLEIEKAGHHSRDVTRQLLSFSRKQIISPKTTNLNRLIMNIKKTLSQLIGETIDLQFLAEEDLWKVRFDPHQIDQILVNLAVNARDAMPDGGVLTIETSNVYLDEVYCSAHMDCRPGHYVSLVVTDNGTGMDKRMLSCIFEPFFTTKDMGKGTGLGLATVYGIVKQNGGFVNVYSEPGKGTSFKIYIPRITGEDEVERETEKTPLQIHSGTILLVEDDDMVGRMTTEILEALGYSVVRAETPLTALAFCENDDTPIDVLITDVVMPEMSGTELRDRIEKIRPGIRVLFMSGYTENVIVRHGVLKKGIHFVQKPFSMNDLAEKVRDAMEDK